MMRTVLRAVCRAAFTLALAALLLAVCRVALWATGHPAWWTIPLAAALLLVPAAVRPLRQLFHDLGEARRLERENTVQTDPATASRMRITWKKAAGILAKSEPGFFSRRRPRPWYICLGQDSPHRERIVGLATAPGEEAPTGEFAWRFSPGAVWLDLDFAWDEDPGNRWPLFLDQFRRHDVGRLAGIVVTLDAAFVVRNDEAELRDAAGLLRRRLGQLRKSIAAGPPVYLLINRVDRLYGMRSVAGTLDQRRLAAPLGEFRLAARESTSQFVRRVVGSAAETLSAAVPPADRSRAAAACQAPGELARLADPLAFLCTEALGENSSADAPALRGVFLGSTGPEGTPLPSLLARLPGVVPADEPTAPSRSWFWTDLVRDVLPRDARLPGRSPGSRAGLAGLLCGSLLLCGLLTYSFLENRSLLLAAAGQIHEPETAEQLGPLQELADLVQRRNRDWWLPRFGMREAEALEGEIKRRFIEGYFDLQTIPHIEGVQDVALTAVDGRSPLLAGNILIKLMLTRHNLSRCLGSGDGAGENGVFLNSVAELLGIATQEETRRQENFYAWAGPQDWMPETRDAMVEFERYLLDKTDGGDLRWLISWARSLPGMRPIRAASQWTLPASGGGDAKGGVIDPVWTADAYRIVRAVLDTVVHDDRNPAPWRERRDAFLSEYRREALEQWRRAAEGLWSGLDGGVPDAMLTPLLRQAARGDDPAAQFFALTREHLLPMFPDDAADPDIAWLRSRRGLFSERERPRGGDTPLTAFIRQVVETTKELGSDEALDAWSRKYLEAGGGERQRAVETERQRFASAIRRIGALAESPEINLAAVRNLYRRSAETPHLPPSPNDPFAEAADAAGALHRHLLESTGGNAWDSLSHLAVYNFVRFLAVRQAALGLDATWRETVYHPYHTLSGGGADRDKVLRELLNAFLNGPARGFWNVENGRLAATAWEGAPLVLSPDFLAFCDQALAAGGAPTVDTLSLPFRVDAVSVDAGARERPQYAEFTVTGDGASEKVLYRNYAASGAFTWRAGTRTAVDVDIVFASFRIRRSFVGEHALEDFVRAFDSGIWTLDRNAFPEHADALAAIGISRVTVRGSFRNSEELFREAARKPPVLPRSVIAPGNDAGGVRSAPGMFAQAAWLRD